jgi:hypothetical protein
MHACLFASFKDSMPPRHDTASFLGTGDCSSPRNHHAQQLQTLRKIRVCRQGPTPVSKQCAVGYPLLKGLPVA